MSAGTPQGKVDAARDGAIATLTLNRPAVRNALNSAMKSDLIEALHTVNADPDIRVVILRGEGDDFCAGADINELARRSSLDSAWLDERADATLEGLRVPSVAALRGNVLGGGFELSLACTLRVVSDTFVGGLPEIKLGIFPALGATQRLPRMVGESVALSMVLTGRTIDGDTAERIGYATRVVPDDQLDDAVVSLARTLASRPPVAIRAATEAIRKSFDLSRADGIDHERRLFGLVCGTEDKEEGVRAWQEKRSPEFTGR